MPRPRRTVQQLREELTRLCLAPPLKRAMVESQIERLAAEIEERLWEKKAA